MCLALNFQSWQTVLFNCIVRVTPLQRPRVRLAPLHLPRDLSGCLPIAADSLRSRPAPFRPCTSEQSSLSPLLAPSCSCARQTVLSPLMVVVPTASSAACLYVRAGAVTRGNIAAQECCAATLICGRVTFACAISCRIDGVARQTCSCGRARAFVVDCRRWEFNARVASTTEREAATASLLLSECGRS